MSRRRRALWLTLAALAAPLPAFALSGEDGSGQVEAGPAALSVSTSLGSCGVIGDGLACQLNVSFNTLPNATSYTATVTSADGSVIDYGSVAPAGTSIWAPYVGAGNYSVRITAYGTPIDPTEDSDGSPDVVATGISGSSEGPGDVRVAPDSTNDADAGGRGSEHQGSGDGEATVEAGAADVSPDCDEPTPAPEETPAPETVTPDPSAVVPPATAPDTEVDPAETDAGTASRGIADSMKLGVASAATATAGADPAAVTPESGAADPAC